LALSVRPQATINENRARSQTGIFLIRVPQKKRLIRLQPHFFDDVRRSRELVGGPKDVRVANRILLRMICLRINIEKAYLTENAEEVNRAGPIGPLHSKRRPVLL
jgi:hypothetical protein